MAASRKLQGEIDRCLKKVTEGVETFEDIWQKVHNATNSNQKEKYEADLKKEIKKLQRLRDQIKSWIASAEIKDKSALLDYRKLIETQMERFKVVERETKTKAYSKEGLGAAQKLDPAQKEREEISAWLTQSIESLNIQIDQYECEMESLLVGKKKRLDKDKQEKLDELKSRVERHRFHIRKLETVLRMLDNMSVEVKKIRSIKDDVEYYIEASHEEDFMHNDDLYDDIIGLAELELGVSANNSTEANGTPTSQTASVTGSCPASPAPMSHNHSIEEPVSVALITTSPPVSTTTVATISESVSTISTVSTVVPSIISTSFVAAPVRKKKDEITKNTIKPMPIKPNSSNSTNSTVNSKAPTIAAVVKSSVSNHTTTTSSVPIMAQSITTQSNTITVGNFATVAASNLHSKHTQPQSVESTSVATSITTSPSSYHTNNVSTTQVNVNNSDSVVNCVSSTPSSLSSTTSPVQSDSHSALSSLKTMAQKAIDQAGIDINQQSSDSKSMSSNVVQNASSHLSVQQQQSQQPPVLFEANISPLLGVAPLGPVPLSKDHQFQFTMLESAFVHLPHPSDSERIKLYLPRNPCSTPHYYNQGPLPHSDSLEFFQRLSTETLFFIFYYMEGSKAQYLAAKALKKQSWRFHTKYMMWFQRHEEPKLINEEYEQGTYIYFDYEKWGQRKKEGFTFEYKYLEDRELN
ncbi:CCR4-NOT complex, subunit 3/ 5,CCR4-Not complex component, Not N-terminal domain,NOT2/NOT3/NOT5 [Cinara cedri]|uniref:CCR4-NOT transcription complex subunit 3 n=2 Tax=Cinara cedri TaxID=506608 RepID=A0A5E4ME32_9HEMI|nr:CCR4-NOT complex, subunit 3/ 5,CCR4-Not complex component, Not N-terminal domain,NOT2/NOT3/NOT5 [Cinara cedri]